MTTTAGPYRCPVGSAERNACVLRLALGLLTFVMAAQFGAAPSGVAVAAGAAAVGWSLLMFSALRSDVLPEQVHLALARWSHWFDIALAVTVYLVFLSDPEATPVVAAPVLAYRLALRHGTAGVIAGAMAFIALVAARIGFTRLTVGEFLIRPPMLFAWTLTATLVLVLATEARARAVAAGRAAREAEEASTGSLAGCPRPSFNPPAPSAEATGNPRLDSLAACLALKLDTPTSVRLTDRELEVLMLLGRGHGYGAVASRLFISQSTVRNHVHNLRMKLELNDRAEMLTLARAVASRSVEVTRQGPGRPVAD